MQVQLDHYGLMSLQYQILRIKFCIAHHSKHNSPKNSKPSNDNTSVQNCDLKDLKIKVCSYWSKAKDCTLRDALVILSITPTGIVKSFFPPTQVSSSTYVRSSGHANQFVHTCSLVCFGVGFKFVMIESCCHLCYISMGNRTESTFHDWLG